jgi:hypothetical protein
MHKNSSLCLIKHYAMKMYEGSGCIDPRILDLDTRGPGRFATGEITPVPTGWAHAVEKKQISFPCQKCNPVARHYSNSVIPTPI